VRPRQWRERSGGQYRRQDSLLVCLDAKNRIDVDLAGVADIAGRALAWTPDGVVVLRSPFVGKPSTDRLFPRTSQVAAAR
jgi:hypothetical protein